MHTNDRDILINNAEKFCEAVFADIDAIALFNQRKVLDAFTKNHISSGHFMPSTGYGYDDRGRDTLNKLFSYIFGAEDAIVSPLIANGTHAISLALFGLLRPNDTLLCISGKPYDTLDEVINGQNIGSLRDFSINFDQIEYKNGVYDVAAIKEYLAHTKPKTVLIQRSKGYAWQDSIDLLSMELIISIIKKLSEQTIIIVDNCYGEFCEKIEPTEIGADIAVGSLIKNPGGGIAPTGGYIVGKAVYIDLIARRLTAPSLGKEVGSYFASYLPFYQGLFLAPSTVKNALKGCALAGKVFSLLGYEVLPASELKPQDIICAIKFNNKQQLITFCQAVQRISPIDSFATPEPWDMPGYSHQVIMAAGTFIQGGSLELTADAPIKEPYIGYLQGGLTYEHIKLAIAEMISVLA
ncbi:MAG: methionine gamma-lyase family protein [Clostridia bacterium]|nr:methionine gamma-lyase family protein [Clostridia bacterium]